ncbi:hypothetical protein SAMN05421866_2879 [Chryseobacterium oranimense]|jgi:hypothetical protein|uniref:Uncharacterized protein n=1 Tax=Chryseobacterium oranimense TaxID=421058 RepID=A0A1M5T914_9FLAO|nr:hypothetical protein BN1195_02178 [Chryseobacterium oranimense G311]SHH47100.1 hypothetical protein SAMN05421866_2879 [Chryseobacterium oranimense]
MLITKIFGRNNIKKHFDPVHHDIIYTNCSKFYQKLNTIIKTVMLSKVEASVSLILIKK